MNIYVAAPWEHREVAEMMGERLSKLGYHVVSRWWNRPEVPEEDILRDFAEQDLDELSEADWLFVLNTKQSEGKAFEQGYAYASGIRVLVIGPRLNLFQLLFSRVDTFDEALEFIQRETDL